MVVMTVVGRMRRCSAYRAWQVASKVAAPPMPVPQYTPRRSGSCVPAPSPAMAMASAAACRAMEVPRSAGTREGGRTWRSSKAQAATGRATGSSPGTASVRAATAERPANRASWKPASVWPSGETRPWPVMWTSSWAMGLSAVRRPPRRR